MKKITLKCLLATVLILTTWYSKAAMVMINVEDFEFSPSVVTVNVGDEIMWVWDNSAGYHTTTSTAIPAGAASWNAMIDPAHTSFSYTITVAGSYDYQCNYHSSMGMVGHITANGTTGIAENAPSLNFLNSYVSGSKLGINYMIPSVDFLTINLYNLTGKIVKQFAAASQQAGKHEETYDIATLSKGIYLLELSTGDVKQTRRILIN